MPLSDRDNYLRNASLTGHEWIPMSVGLSQASWYECGRALEEAVLRHPTIRPGYEAGSSRTVTPTYGAASSGR